jgi:O-antigen/teichoic acid export membrane protein
MKFLPGFLQVKLDGRVYLQNVISNAAWQFADNILRMVINLSVGVWVARYLGPEQLGVFSYALAFVAIFTSFATLGLEDIVVRDLVGDPESKEETLGTAFVLKLVSGGLSFVGALAIILFIRPDDVLNHWLVGIIAAGTVFQAFGAIEIWFYSQVQAKFIVIPKNVAFVLCSFIKVLLILYQAPLIAFGWVATLEVVVGMLGLVLTYKAKGSSLTNWRFSLAKAGSLLKNSWPLMLSSMVIMTSLRIDQVMLGEIAGDREVGIYSVAVRMAEIWMFIPMVIFWSVFPAIVEAKLLSEELFFGRLQKLYNLMVFSAYAVAIPVTLLADWLVVLLFGEVFVRAGSLLSLLVWGNLFTNIEIARSSFLSSMNWTRIHLVTVSLGCVLNIILNYMLIPEYGSTGAVIASLISYWFAAHGTCFLFKPLIRTGTMLTKAILYPKIW